MYPKASRQVRLAVFASLVAAAGISPPAMAQESTARRTFLLDDYSIAATFKLQRGNIILWNKSAETPETIQHGLLEFRGVLDNEAAGVIDRLIARQQVRFLSLDSPGGLVEPTLRLGDLVRKSRISTIVEGGRDCYSACALLFLAGERRVRGDFIPPNTLVTHDEGLVGFHAPYIPQRDGTAIYLQDVKSSSVCPYIHSMLSNPGATELCEYSLATRGMATFAFDAAQKLGIFTSREADFIRDAVSASSIDEQGWVACLRAGLQFAASSFKNRNEGGMKSNEYKRLTWPCSPGGRFAAPPKEKATKLRLERAVQRLGVAPFPKELRKVAVEDGVEQLLKIGLTQADERFIACERAKLTLSDTSRTEVTPNDREQQWTNHCANLPSYENDRIAQNSGSIPYQVIPELLAHLSRQRGAAWFPEDLSR